MAGSVPSASGLTAVMAGSTYDARAFSVKGFSSARSMASPPERSMMGAARHQARKTPSAMLTVTGTTAAACASRRDRGTP